MTSVVDSPRCLGMNYHSTKLLDRIASHRVECGHCISLIKISAFSLLIATTKLSQCRPHSIHPECTAVRSRDVLARGSLQQQAVPRGGLAGTIACAAPLVLLLVLRLRKLLLLRAAQTSTINNKDGDPNVRVADFWKHRGELVILLIYYIFT